MSEFHGLHNPERHKAFSGQWAECLPDLGGCLSECGDGDPCRCCLASEVDRLTAKIEQVKQAAAEVLAERDRRIAVALEPHVVREWPGTKICASCLVPWPCRYVKVLRGESDE